MTRRLLTLFAPSMLAAQQTCGSSDPRICADLQKRTYRRPKNGECPVCGTMAKPYHVSTGDEHFNMGLTNFRRIDCEHCNTTFRQWAEGKEPKR